MQYFTSDYYLWIKAFHIIAIICWMAGIFYLPRLFVYHRDVAVDSEAAQIFQIMERRLYKIIVMPSMVLSLASGLFLVIILDIWSAGWLHVKITGVLALIIYQALLNCWRLALAQGTCHHTSKFFRMINEIPPILMIVIVISVVVKPF